MRDLLLLRIDRMPLERGDQLVALDLAAAKRISTYQVWWLMPEQINSSSAAVLCTEHARDLPPAVLHAVAEADGIDLAVFDRRPGVHRHRVGVVEQLGAGLADLADVPAEIEERRNELLSKPIRYGSRNGTLLTVLISQLPKLFGEAILVTRTQGDRQPKANDKAELGKGRRGGNPSQGKFRSIQGGGHL